MTPPEPDVAPTVPRCVSAEADARPLNPPANAPSAVPNPNTLPALEGDDTPGPVAAAPLASVGAVLALSRLLRDPSAWELCAEDEGAGEAEFRINPLLLPNETDAEEEDEVEEELKKDEGPRDAVERAARSAS